MERQTETHLSPDEIDSLLRGGHTAQAALRHLNDCDVCRSMLDAHSQEDGRLNRLRSGAHSQSVYEPLSGCPCESDWLKLASGMTRDSDAAPLLRHSAVCDHCAKLLREALADFSDEVTSEEEAMLAQLDYSSRKWQQRSSASLSTGNSSPGIVDWVRDHLLVPLRIPVWGYAACAAVLCSAGAFLCLQPPSIETLLASAYTDQRPLELRLPGAAYAPVRLVRGSTDYSQLDRPTALLEGEARIARELTKTPDNPRWLTARGRAELLERDYDSAVASFQRALHFQPDSAALTTDLASALFERAEARNSQADYNVAAEMLSRALTSTPEDPVVLFNRAIVYERLHFYDKAIQDWQHYLRVESATDWTPEAMQHLKDVQEAKHRSSAAK
jgi:tetratricopeptide (TPR) repeat protein